MVDRTASAICVSGLGLPGLLDNPGNNDNNNNSAYRQQEEMLG